MSDLLDRIRHLERASRPLEPGAARRKRLRGAIIASSERFLRKLEHLNGDNLTDDKGAGLLRAPISEHGIPLEEAIKLLERDVVVPGGNTASGRHLAYIPGGGLYHSALGDYFAAVTNKYAGVFFGGPGAVRMENMRGPSLLRPPAEPTCPSLRHWSAWCSTASPRTRRHGLRRLGSCPGAWRKSSPRRPGPMTVPVGGGSSTDRDRRFDLSCLSSAGETPGYSLVVDPRRIESFRAHAKETNLSTPRASSCMGARRRA